MIFGKKAEDGKERQKALEAENRRLAGELDRVKKDYAELQRIQSS